MCSPLLCAHAQSLLSMYGLDELSDTDGEGELPDNPMSPQQIALMRNRARRTHRSPAALFSAAVLTRRGRAHSRRLRVAAAVDRQIALTRELDIDDSSPPRPLPPPTGASVVPIAPAHAPPEPDAAQT